MVFWRRAVPETTSYGTGCIRAPYRKGPLPFWRLLYSVRAMLSFFWQFEKFGTGEGLLWYGICARCEKQASVVRDAFSEAFGVKNRLLRYGRDIRYRKRPPTVRGTSSFGGTRYRKRPPTVRGTSSFGGTRYRKRPPTVRGASSARITKKGMQKNCTPTINSPRQSNHNYLISIRRVA